MASPAREHLTATARAKKGLTSVVIATVLAAGGILAAAAPASATTRIVGPFSSIVNCNAERRTWMTAGYHPEQCILMPNNVSYMFFVDY